MERVWRGRGGEDDGEGGRTPAPELIGGYGVVVEGGVGGGHHFEEVLEQACSSSKEQEGGQHKAE